MTSTDTARDEALAWIAGRLQFERLFDSLRAEYERTGEPVDLGRVILEVDEPATAEAA